MVIAPTIDSRTARLFRSAWWEFNAANLHYFSADTLQSLLLKSGFGDPIIDARRLRGVARILPREDSGGVVRRVPPRSQAGSFVRRRRSLRRRAFQLLEQPTRLSRAIEAGGVAADAVGDRARLQREGDASRS